MFTHVSAPFIYSHIQMCAKSARQFRLLTNPYQTDAAAKGRADFSHIWMCDHMCSTIMMFIYLFTHQNVFEKLSETCRQICLVRNTYQMLGYIWLPHLFGKDSWANGSIDKCRVDFVCEQCMNDV